MTALRAEMDFINYLASRGIRVNRPVLTLAKKRVQTVNTSAGVYHAMVFEALKGKIYETEEMTPVMFTAWGRALGELHNASQGYPAVGRATWKDYLDRVDHELPASDSVARKTLDRLSIRLGEMQVEKIILALSTMILRWIISFGIMINPGSSILMTVPATGLWRILLMPYVTCLMTGPARLI